LGTYEVPDLFEKKQETDMLTKAKEEAIEKNETNLLSKVMIDSLESGGTLKGLTATSNYNEFNTKDENSKFLNNIQIMEKQKVQDKLIKDSQDINYQNELNTETKQDIEKVRLAIYKDLTTNTDSGLNTGNTLDLLPHMKSIESNKELDPVTIALGMHTIQAIQEGSS
jgi:hypothetical protein